MTADAIESLIRSMICGVVDDNVPITITLQESGTNDRTYYVTLPSESAGQAIGRQGSLVEAMRTILQSAARKCDIGKIFLKITPFDSSSN